MLCHRAMTSSQTTQDTGAYDEALERYHRTGPEFEGWLSNHGPMVVDALSRRGASDVVHRWTDDYSGRLELLPAGTGMLTAAERLDALGDARRLGDWIAFFEREVTEAAWRDVLAEWWPRLLPGIAAGATHGVIRVGHAVQALRGDQTAPRVRELAHGLGYWAARWQAVPLVAASGSRTPHELVESVPRVRRQVDGIRDRLAQLPETDNWAGHMAALQPATSIDDVPRRLNAIVDAAVIAYPLIAVGQPTMLVHAATAPHAVARTLPSLPQSLWHDSLDAAWAATGAVLAAYLPASLGERRNEAIGPDDAWAIAVRHGGEHVIKLADTALDVHARTGHPASLAAITTAAELDA